MAQVVGFVSFLGYVLKKLKDASLKISSKTTALLVNRTLRKPKKDYRNR